MVWAVPMAWCLHGASADVLHLENGRTWRGRAEQLDEEGQALLFQVVLDGPAQAPDGLPSPKPPHQEADRKTCVASAFAVSQCPKLA